MKKYIPYFVVLCAILLIAVMIDANNKRVRESTILDHPLVETYIQSIISTLGANLFAATATPTPLREPWDPNSIILIPLGSATPEPPFDDPGWVETLFPNGIVISDKASDTAAESSADPSWFEEFVQEGSILSQPIEFAP